VRKSEAEKKKGRNYSPKKKKSEKIRRKQLHIKISGSKSDGILREAAEPKKIKEFPFVAPPPEKGGGMVNWIC